MTPPNDAEIKWQAEVISMRSLLSPDDAEYLIRFTNGNTELLTQCEELANRGIGHIAITEWIKVKMGFVEPGGEAYTTCERILREAAEGDRPNP